MVYATDIRIGNIEDSGGRTQSDTPMLSPPIFGLEERFTTCEISLSELTLIPHLGVFAGSEISYGGFRLMFVNQYDRFGGGQDIFNLGV